MTKRVSVTLTICALAGIAAVGALFLPARSTADAGPPASTTDVVNGDTSPVVDTQTVSIESFTFGGATTVGPGEQITVSNLDGAPHTMTANDGAFDTGIIDGGAQTTLTAPNEPGTYSYFCALHPSMVSTITVQS